MRQVWRIVCAIRYDERTGFRRGTTMTLENKNTERSSPSTSGCSAAMDDATVKPVRSADAYVCPNCGFENRLRPEFKECLACDLYAILEDVEE